MMACLVLLDVAKDAGNLEQLLFNKLRSHERTDVPLNLFPRNWLVQGYMGRLLHSGGFVIADNQHSSQDSRCQTAHPIQLTRFTRGQKNELIL